MCMIVRIAINSKELRCYSIRRITHTNILKPVGKICRYEIMECYSRKKIGTLYHGYDDPPEKLVRDAMHEILLENKDAT
jgi:hypothetical protein